ncbi:hypothetical protein OQH61_05660 [Helicobacter sp. MIT 21-1697]|uniref:hypothetical protein n=1 Tax=Helicobacter sp. MIT 21-1697 TaxID=2993733 RepID=UPI00224B6B0E|nr:hypothetical protein [Helicobacter sp. MIT 21-1697]MCX2717220.1 hypothetical protein [Helicobacter sp. MIT 21-1697]
MKNISYRIYAFFIVLLGFSLSSIIFFTSDNALYANIGKEVPNIEISDFTLYLLNAQYTQAISQGSKALRFEDHEEIYDIFVNQINNKLNEYMYAPFVLSKNKLYTFSQGADYLRIDGLSFWSKWGIYNYQKRIFKGKGDFILQNSTTKATGKNIYYDMFKGDLRADSIKADIAMGER